MILNYENKIYKIPSLPQVADYRYSKSLDCSCLNYEGFCERMNHWHCDGVYESNVGLMICFTCKLCGDRFFYHLRDNAEDYADLGVFDEFLISKK